VRLLRLELAGFGPYRDRFEIDFESFDADGLYLIAGPTGAGKSTILDAITYALYGSAPRYDGAPHVRSDLAGPTDLTWVELELAVGDRVLRVRRTPEYERPKQRGEGLTRERASATLEERTGEGWRLLSSSVAEVGTEVGLLLGLRKDEFLKVILLAQGGFAEFLAATSDERKALLERLFGTGSMRQLRELLQADAKAIAAEREALERVRDERGARALDAARALRDDAEPVGAEPVGAEEAAPEEMPVAAPVDEAALEAVEAAIDARVAGAADAADRAAVRERAAREARDAGRALVERIARRDAALAALARLDEAAAATDADRARLADADRAAEAAPALDRWTRADAAAARGLAALAAAVESLPAGVDPARPAVERAHEEAVDAASRAAETRQLESSLPQLERQATAAREAAARQAEAVTAAKQRRADGPAARRALAEARDAAAELAAGTDAATQRVAAVTERLAARDAAEALAEPVRDARADAAATAKAQRDSADELHRFQAARIDGMAGELAGELVDGEPCAVCGSVEHPAPHAPATDAVTADDVTRALERSRRALAAASAAHEALAALEQQLAAHEARAGDADRAALEEELERCRAAERAALEAAAARADADRRLAEHDAQAERLDAEIADLEESAAERAAEAAAARTRHDDARDRLARELGDHDGAAALLAAATARRDALRRWLDADAEAAAARDEQADAAAEGAEALAVHDLPEREAAAALRLEPVERAALRSRIEAHDAAVASARGVLAQPELADLGDAPDLEPLEAALRDASAASKQAARAAAAAETTRDHAAGDLAAAREAIRSLAEGAEHAGTVRGLAHALGGDNERRQDIETYVLATRLATIIDAANLRLSAMTEGRFALVHDDARAARGRASGLGIAVLDAHTGLARTTRSLSGGETFLASLSLALGLADVVQAEAGGVSLETLFVDEGFGSLDQDTLEAAMATLDELRAGGRSVGVISHVQQMQERIPSRIRVEPVPGGGSRIVVTPTAALQGAAVAAG
jgi:DNA repair protein SbcC/Rad50